MQAGFTVLPFFLHWLPGKNLRNKAMLGTFVMTRSQKFCGSMKLEQSSAKLLRTRNRFKDLRVPVIFVCFVMYSKENLSTLPYFSCTIVG